MAKGTATSVFGVGGRMGHNSDKFYNGRIYSDKKLLSKNGMVVEESPIDELNIDEVFCQSSENMEQLPSNSVHLMVTSPPYNVGKEYDDDLSVDEHRQLLRNVWHEVYRTLVFGGRACINIANIGRKPYIPLNSYIISDMLDMGFLMRGEIIWNKAASAGTSCAWGSWRSPSNPVLRDTHEYIMVFCKGDFARQKPQNAEKESTITKEDFLEFTKSVWTFPTESAKRVKHAAPYPVELPRRFIELYTYSGDIVLDPFMGSGTTAEAAKYCGRHYVGYEISEKYVDVYEERMRKLDESLSC